jgi:two-component system nitrogen regulation response regulator NtrX
MEALQRYRWKGNIRELRNTVERMIIMSPSDTIELADLPGAVRHPGTGTAPSRSAAGTDTSGAGTLRDFKDNAERAFLVARLREHGWNISKTAEVIDTPRSNLYKKLEQYQISQESDG